MRLQDEAALWGMGLARAGDVVMVACDALVAGSDGEALRMLAAVPLAQAEQEVWVYLPAALTEQCLECHEYGSRAARVAAVHALCRRLLTGDLTARQLTQRVHAVFGHELSEAERLAELDDEYDLHPDYSERNLAEIDAEVISEARRATGL